MSKVTDFPTQGTIGTSLRPKRYDIEVYQDDSFEFKLEFLQPVVPPATVGVPVNITGWVGLCQVKDADGVTVGTATITIVSPASNGVLNCNFDSVTGIEAGEYSYDIQITDDGGRKRTFIGGKFNVTEDISE
jgi:hypothetical protein